MSDNSVSQTKYDVFVSFRGEVRCGFLSHLIGALKRNKINAFVDDQLEKGEEIAPSLVEAIERSFISLIIFSQDYASSRWCLDELVKIHECREKYEQIVIPVFFNVKPTDVRYQTASYENAFAAHEIKYDKTKVDNWRQALKKSADLSGIESTAFKHDNQLLEEIVQLVLMKLGKSLVNSKGLVGIDEKIKDVESLIRNKPKDTRLIGIWGMGGIGKTTLAREVFTKLQYENGYDGCCFLANEREQSSRRGIDSLKKEIFSELLANVVKIGTSLCNDNDRRIGHMKVLIVLDDVNESSHLEKLLGSLDDFGSGSRIIITTRDEQVLKANKADEIYRFREFNLVKALELFNLNAFNQSDHPQEYGELSKRVVDYAKGIPLAVKVLAGLLCGKNKEEWKGMLDMLERMPPTDVYKVMKLSYDGLDRKEKQIFLDLACFFLRSCTMVNVSDLKSLLNDNESDNSVAFRLGRLKDKALITFSEDNIVCMHDILQETALEIIRQGEDPKSRSQLWDPDDIYDALKNDKGIEAIRSMRIHLPTFKKQVLSPRIFAKMNGLKFLEISGNDNIDCYDQLIRAAEGLQFLELRFLCWYYCPLKSLPENFSAEKLVILILLGSEIENLWHGVKNLVNLKKFNLSWSEKLEELPDLSKATNLEVLNLEACFMLTRVHASVFSLGNLKELNLSRLTKLEELPDLSKATNLEVLLLDGCSMLTRVHPSVFSLGKLKILSLRLCLSLTILKSDSHLYSISSLNLGLCMNLTEFSLISKNMKVLILSFCKKLRTIPELPLILETLDVECCYSLQTIPELPPSLKILNARYCRSLRSVFLFPSTAVEQLKENRIHVLFGNCMNLDQHSLEAIALNAQINLMKFANQHLSSPNHGDVENYNDYENNYYCNQVLYVFPGSSVPKWFEYRTTNNYIIIDISSAPPSPLTGFIFCFVLGGYIDESVERIEACINISDDDGDGKKDSVRMYIDYNRHVDIQLNHVCVMYDQRCSAFLNSRVKNRTRFRIEVTIIMSHRKFKESFILPQQVYGRQLFKGFGVSPISTSAYNSFIQQMKLRDSMYQFQ